MFYTNKHEVQAFAPGWMVSYKDWSAENQMIVLYACQKYEVPFDSHL